MTGLAAALLLAATAPVAGADGTAASGAAERPGITLTEAVEHVPIAADSLPRFVAAFRAMQAEADGESVARTRSALQVSYRLVEEAGRCRMQDLVVALDVTVRLPEWTPPGPVRPDARAEWARVREGIAVHERGHRDLAVDAAERLAAALSAPEFAVQPDCRALERRILRERMLAQMRFQNRDQAYDRRTRHGLTQVPKAD